MSRSSLWVVVFILSVLTATDSLGQTKKPVKKPSNQKTAKKAEKKPVEDKKTDVAQDEKKVRDIVAFLEYVLNTIGSSGTATSDKEVLITESYSKIFRDSKVQIEDDLDEERDVSTNKDVVAYLKDVDFFFKEVRFEFIIDGITSGTNSSGKTFYKVALKRNLKGTTNDGKAVNNTKPRFIEVNYDPVNQDLKIESIYTTEFNDKAALSNWWKQLSFEWQNIFRKKLGLQIDSIGLGDIRTITAITELDLGGNSFIQELDPLGQLTNLKTLNLSGTNVADLTAIRNLTELVSVDLSNTKVSDLSILKYADKLEKLNVSHTPVTDISVIEKMASLNFLDVSSTPITDFSPIAHAAELSQLNLRATSLQDLSTVQGLSRLKDLNVSTTPTTDVAPLAGLTTLEVLSLDSTRVSTVEPLKGLESLTVLSVNHTSIADLKPLQKLPKLEKIYCDQTQVKREGADAFMAANPKVLVVFDSKDLKAWWETLTPEWQAILGKAANVGADPSKEELARVTSVDSINLAGTGRIRSLDPLRQLQKLQVLVANNTSITDLSPLAALAGVRYIDVSSTDVSDFTPISNLRKLKVLRADKTKVDNLNPLSRISALEELYVDQTPVHDIIVQEYLSKNSKTLVVHKTIHLNRWWKAISSEWKEVFRGQMQDTTASRQNLHRLVEKETLVFKDAPVTDLTALSEFVRLKELHFSGTNIGNLTLPANLTTLKSLHATNGPVQKLDPLQALPDLEDLDVSNTPIDELKPMSALVNLKKFNCSGTQIRKLDPLSNLQYLEVVDCGNTRVSNLDPLLNPPLKTLKCYNTKVSAREIESFKRKKPDCNVVYYR
jgi:Leucine-rich repeat (LRR) protein